MVSSSYSMISCDTRYQVTLEFKNTSNKHSFRVAKFILENRFFNQLFATGFQRSLRGNLSQGCFIQVIKLSFVLSYFSVYEPYNLLVKINSAISCLLFAK